MIENILNRKILIVDDATENVDILGSILSDYKRQVALNGEKALKIAFSDNKPDLILLDVMMPEMDGFEVCKRLKENPETKDIPVIFITAKSEVEDETKGLELGAVDFIPKPISPPVVLARVKNQLELLTAREKLQIQNAELTVRNKYITDSINYAKKIQSAILPAEETLNAMFPDHFIIFRPKDIVSGDFYWANTIDNKKIIAVVDCTGHGVPGSLMSMIGNTLLNEIITYKKVLDPGEILDQLNAGVITELNKDINQESFDGMDLALCVIDEKNKTISYAGAYRPFYYFSNNQFSEIHGDRKSIGDKRKQINYKTNTLKYEHGFSFYLFTDGIIDQNNTDGVKFGSRKFKELLNKINPHSCKEKYANIVSELKSHQGNEVQRDDISLIGINLR